MPGHKRPRGPNAWQLIVTVPNGRGGYRQVTRTFHGGPRAADHALADLAAEVHRGRHPGRAGTLTELIEAWLAVSGHEQSTLVTERADLRRYIAPGIGNRQVRNLRPADLTSFYADLRARGGQDGQPLSSATVERVHALIRRALAYGVEIEWCPSNPAALSRRPKPERRRHTPPSASDLVRLLEAAAAESPAWGAYLRVMAATGARRAELCALRWRDVSVDSGYIVIDAAVGVGADGPYLKDTKTDKRRVVPIGPGTVDALCRHADWRDLTQHRDAFVFTDDPDGVRPWRPGTVTNKFVRLAKSLGVDCRLHDLRHFVGTSLIDAGIPVTAVSAYLGHDRSSTTTDIYGHALDPSVTAGADVIDRLLARPAVTLRCSTDTP